MHILPLSFIFENFSPSSNEALKLSNFCPSAFPPPWALFFSTFGSNYQLSTQQLAAYTYILVQRGGKVILKRRR